MCRDYGSLLEETPSGQQGKVSFLMQPIAPHTPSEKSLMDDARVGYRRNSIQSWGPAISRMWPLRSELRRCLFSQATPRPAGAPFAFVHSTFQKVAPVVTQGSGEAVDDPPTHLPPFSISTPLQPTREKGGEGRVVQPVAHVNKMRPLARDFSRQQVGEATDKDGRSARCVRRGGPVRITISHLSHHHLHGGATRLRSPVSSHFSLCRESIWKSELLRLPAPPSSTLRDEKTRSSSSLQGHKRDEKREDFVRRARQPLLSLYFR